MSEKFSRRNFLKGALGTSMGLSLRTAITGLPASFLMAGHTFADSVSSKFTIIAASNAGEAFNVSGPGTFADLGSATINHPIASRVGSLSVNVGSMNLSADDLENSASIRLGGSTGRLIEMARAYRALPEDLLEHFVWLNYRTLTNAHGELASVMNYHGSLKGASGRGLEQLPSAIAQENATALNTVIKNPLSMRSGLSFEGGPLTPYNPSEVKALFERATTAIGGVENFGVMYDHMIDQVYDKVKTEGTPRQRKFLDNHASSRQQAAQVGEDLNALLSDITDNGFESQIKLALASIRVKLTPVVVINHSWSGDNHQDTNLITETQRTLDMIRILSFYWQSLKDMSLLDDVLFSTIDVFGRTTQLNSSGGRNHYGQFTGGIMLGKHLKGGWIGGIETTGRNGVQSAAFNSQTGLLDNPDIAGNETLGAYLKTQMSAAGVSSERCDVRLPDAKTVKAVF